MGICTIVTNVASNLTKTVNTMKTIRYVFLCFHCNLNRFDKIHYWLEEYLENNYLALSNLTLGKFKFKNDLPSVPPSNL